MPSVRVFFRTIKSPSWACRQVIQKPSLTSIGCCNGLCMVFIAALIIGTIKSARFYRLLAFDLLSKTPAYSLVLSGIQTILLENQPQSPCLLASMMTILFISQRTQQLKIYAVVFLRDQFKFDFMGIVEWFVEVHFL
jgi:hypothetical protein